MEIQLLAFGIAKDILGESQTTLSLPGPTTVAELKSLLSKRYPAFTKLASFSIAVNTSYATDDQAIRPEDEVVIIPPVSGG